MHASRSTPPPVSPRRTPGYTLVELLAATASASILMVGLSASMYVASQGVNIDRGAVSTRTTNDLLTKRMLDDVSQALEFKQRTAEALKFTVPDITGDGAVDTVCYQWSGAAGDPLLYTLNNGTPQKYLTAVQSLSFAYLDRTVTATDVTVAPAPPWPVLKGYSSFYEHNHDMTQLELAPPAGVQPGDLLIGCVAVENNVLPTFSGPAAWTPINMDQASNKVTFGVWWRVVGASEPATYRWQWADMEQPVGLILHISNQYAGNPLTAFAVDKGTSDTPPCPATSSTLDHSMVLRLGGFDGDEITASGVTGLASHTSIFMESGEKHVSLGAGYRIQTAPANVGAASFELDKNEEYCTATLIIAPKTN
ncbi:MAG: hypothetical protein AAFV43_09535 [Planctomycetota bacterium]